MYSAQKEKRLEINPRLQFMFFPTTTHSTAETYLLQVDAFSDSLVIACISVIPVSSLFFCETDPISWSCQFLLQTV